MFTADSLFHADWPKARYVLPRDVAAIQVIPDGVGRIRLGTIVKLPEGADVDVCGEGFNDRTKKVCWQGGFYYIFAEDLELKDAERTKVSAAG